MEDIIFSTIAAVTCVAETWNEIESYGESKEEWVRTYLELPNGIPSHDTFNRFFSSLDPSASEEAFLSHCCLKPCPKQEFLWMDCLSMPIQDLIARYSGKYA